MAVLMSAVLLSSILHCVAGTPIDGPQPMNALAPLGTKVTFTCIVNITELTVHGEVLVCVKNPSHKKKILFDMTSNHVSSSL